MLIRTAVLVLALLALAPARAEDLPDHHAEDPTAAEVTAANLLASERFWPYTVQLSTPWKPPGAAQALPAETRGVLVRVESPTSARIDFGRNGIFATPVPSTDLVARANRIRLGQEEKLLPNLVEAIGPRLVSADGEAPRAVPISATYTRAGFLCVFVDPGSPDLLKLAKALAPLRERRDVLTVFFPQGRPSDVVVHAKLRSLDWKVPFVFQHLSEPYTRTLVGEAPALPLVALFTREGRLVFQQSWQPATRGELEVALESSFGPAPAADREKNP